MTAAAAGQAKVDLAGHRIGPDLPQGLEEAVSVADPSGKVAAVVPSKD